jgi:hypothetical protein
MVKTISLGISKAPQWTYCTPLYFFLATFDIHKKLECLYLVLVLLNNPAF